MFANLPYYAHSAQDKLGNLLPYEHWQTLQSHSVNVGEMTAEFARVPKPFRIGSLDNPEEEHQKLLNLVLEPIINKGADVD